MSNAYVSINCARAHVSTSANAAMRSTCIFLCALLLLAPAFALTCTDGFYTFTRDEHEPACYFHATKHDGCPRENEGTDLVYVDRSPLNSKADVYLFNGTGAPLELSAAECASQFRIHLYLTAIFSPPNAEGLDNVTLGNNPDTAPHTSTYPYIFLDGKYVHGAVLHLEKYNLSTTMAHAYYMVTGITPIVEQSEQPHGIRPPDELDHTLAYAGLGSAASLFILLLIVLIISCRRHEKGSNLI